MLKEADILKAVRNEIKAIYPNYEIYLDDTKENFKTPCFFLKLIRSTNMHTKYLNFNVCTLYITYFPAANSDALGMYEVKDVLIEKFWQGLQVTDRHIKFEPINSNTDGQDSNIAQIALPFSYYDAVPKEEPAYTIGQLHQSQNTNYRSDKNGE